MSARNKGDLQITAAAKAGISERSGRRIENGNISQGDKPMRHWRTRKDHFKGVWENEVVPMLKQNAELQPLTLFEHFAGKYPEKFQRSKLRTFQRKVKKWKSLSGVGKTHLAAAISHALIEQSIRVTFYQGGMEYMSSNIGNSILEYFSSVADPRIELKTMHILIEIIAMTLCAIIAGADDWVEVANFSNEKKEWLKTFLKLPNGIRHMIPLVVYSR